MLFILVSCIEVTKSYKSNQILFKYSKAVMDTITS